MEKLWDMFNVQWRSNVNSLNCHLHVQQDQESNPLADLLQNWLDKSFGGS